MKELIGKTIAYNLMGNTYVVNITGFEQEGEMYDADSYIGKQAILFKNGKTLVQDWSRSAKSVERLVVIGEYKVL